VSWYCPQRGWVVRGVRLLRGPGLGTTARSVGDTNRRRRRTGPGRPPRQSTSRGPWVGPNQWHLQGFDLCQVVWGVRGGDERRVCVNGNARPWIIRHKSFRRPFRDRLAFEFLVQGRRLKCDCLLFLSAFLNGGEVCLSNAVQSLLERSLERVAVALVVEGVLRYGTVVELHHLLRANAVVVRLLQLQRACYQLARSQVVRVTPHRKHRNNGSSCGFSCLSGSF